MKTANRLVTLLAFTLCSILGLSLPAKANVPCSVPFTLTNGTTADATQVMANYNALIACFANAAAAGANSDITSLNALTSPIAPVAGGSSAFIATTATGGAANAQTIASTTPSGFGLTANFRVYAKIGITNTGPTTLTVGSTATTNVFKTAPGGPVALTGGELQIGDVALFAYDGTQYELLNPHIAQGPISGAPVNIASAATTDIASVGSHNVNITGTTTITNLGNTLAGQVAFPRYYLTLNGSQINFNGTNCSTTGGCITTPGSVNFSTSSAGEQIIAEYVGQGSNLGAGAGNWVIKSVPRSAQGYGRFATSPQVFTTTPSSTYTPTVGMLFVEVECIGAGGAGGGSGSATFGGGGGGGGSYGKGFFSAATVGASQTVTIGVGGTGVSGATGNNGGGSSFGALLTTNGGTGGSLNSGDVAAGGPGGSAGSGGYLNLAGSPGQQQISAETNSFPAPGYGGNGIYGLGSGIARTATTGGIGLGGTAPGAGGGGSWGASFAGGAGANGICIVHEFIE